MSSWMTIPEWSDVRQVNVYHREQEKPEKPEKPEEKIGHSGSRIKQEEKTGQSEIAVKPENLHVLVRGTVQLPADPNAQYEIWVSADDHYQLWVGGIYQGQGPITSNSECAFYDRYPIWGLGMDLSRDSVKQTVCDDETGTSAIKRECDQPEKTVKPVTSDVDDLFVSSSQAVSRTEGSSKGESRTVTIALHLYYHGRVSRSWNSADGRFGLWLSVQERMISKNDSVSDFKSMETADKNKSQTDDTASDENFREVAHADETWRYMICKAYSGETVGYDTQFLENFDSRLWPEGWEQPGYYVENVVQDRNVIEQPGNDMGLVRNRDDAGRSGYDDGQIMCGAECFGDYTNQRAEDETNRGVEDKEKVADIGKKTWGCLVPALWADYRMLPRLIQPLEEKKVFARKQWEQVVSTTDENDIRLVLDFGREITGAIVAEAVGPAGAQVLIECGEELVDNQEALSGKEIDEPFDQVLIEDANCVTKPETAPETAKQNASLSGDFGKARVAAPLVRWDMRCGCAYQEVWTLGDGVSHLHPYDYKGFRYAQLTFPGTVELRQIYAWVRHYPMEDDACTLRCEDRELEQIFEICKNAVRCCSQDAYLDCPTREKGQYLGDALVTARSQVWLTGSTELLRKCIGDFILSASISPSLMAVAPGSEMQEIADYSLLFPLLPMTDYEFTGDLTFLARCYPAVRKVTESFLIYQSKDGLLENVSALWNLVDWPENLRDHYDFPLTRPIVGEGCHNVINALWYGANKVQEDMECLLDLPVTGRCGQIAESFRNVFYREEQSLFADSEVSAHCSIHANLYASYFGLLPKEAQEPYVRMLRTPGRVCGALPCYFALKSLAQMGRVQDCFDMMTREDAYGWRNMVREGASASFEAWGKEQKWNTSLCHAWSSGFLPLFIEEIAGLHPDPKQPEGYRLEKPDIEGPVFELQVPWRGQKLRV